jgi:RecJ-like exonuclease
MGITKKVLMMGVLAFVLGFGGVTNRASAEDAAPAKAAVAEKSETKDSAAADSDKHCEKCHGKKVSECGKTCPDCKKESCAKCEHCKGQKNCSKCSKCHEHDKEAEKSATPETKPAAN